ncbi:hypothetical protein GGE65_007080 [Skermanella aerolata]|uniref:hypothetical protein n=1 Tax=Skermanella aerolata TaxID=393310 RepID=UPI003D1F5380
MDKNRILFLALETRSERLKQGTLTKDEVCAIGAAIGLDDNELIAVLDALVEQSLVRIEWGGYVRVLDGKVGGADASSNAPNFSGNFHGTVIYSSGPNADIDARVGGQGGAYKAGQAVPENAVATLAAALMELRAQLGELTGNAAAKATELEAAANDVAKEAIKEEADRTSLGERLKKLTAKLEEVARLQAVAGKLEPTLELMRNSSKALWSWLSG